MVGSNPAISIRKAVNHDVATGRKVQLLRELPVLIIRVRNVDRLVELALCIPPVENILALGRLVIALLLLLPDWGGAKRNLVCAESLALCHQIQLAIFLEDDNLIGPNRRRWSRCQTAGQNRDDQCRNHKLGICSQLGMLA